jgi:hypothetical protein
LYACRARPDRRRGIAVTAGQPDDGDRLLRLLEESLVPGVQAKADLDALPNSLRWAGLARWAQQAVDRVERAIGWLFSPLAERCDGALLVRFAGPPTPARPADDRSHLGGGERPDSRTARLVRVA